jgi:glutathione S-transferase
MRLFRFPHSPYALKLQALLELMGRRYTVVDVGFLERGELLALSGGLYVPALQEEDGTVTVDSRRIAERLVAQPGGAAMAPSPWEGPIWAVCDWIDGPLEELLFRLAAPSVRAAWTKPEERAFYTLIKERKFGAGCLEQWARDRTELIARSRSLLAPISRTLSAQPFLFGDKPTLADATLYGQFGMLAADRGLEPAQLGEAFPGWLDRLAKARHEKAVRG